MRLPSSKPISSPSRGEKFPPPLMRFLKSNGGSRSRGSSRSRSSPMFVRSHKKNANGGGVETTQEPSSPKVTCMGQVRVRRSKKTSSSIVDRTGSGRKASKTTPKRGSCRWIRKALFCRCFSGKSKPRSCRPVWRSCCGFFGVGFGRKVETSEESGKQGSRTRREVVDEEYEDDEQQFRREEEEDEEEDKEERAFAPASTPPKNALLLMRCRSDPCRNRFWNSPSPSVTEDRTEVKNRTVVETEEEDEDEEDDEEEETPTMRNESICTDSSAESRADPKIEEKLGFCQGFENSSKGRIRSAKTSTTTARIKVESSSKGSGGGYSSSSASSSSSRPLTLIRCKSEPASRRRSLKLETTETCFWKNRRSGFDEKCPPQFLL